MTGIKMTIPLNGDVTIHVASLVQDFWDDYIYFRQQAESVDESKDLLLYKRYVRASMHSYFSYIECLMNSWITQRGLNINLEATSLNKKIECIQNEKGNDQTSKFSIMEKARDIRNDITHFKPTISKFKSKNTEIEIMEWLMEGHFFHDADEFTNWLDRASKELNLERNNDVQKIAEQYIQSLSI